MYKVTKNGWEICVSIFLASGFLLGGMVAQFLRQLKNFQPLPLKRQFLETV